MDREKLTEVVINELAEVMKIDKKKVLPESSLMDDLDISSLEILVLIGNLEAKTGVAIGQEDVAFVDTVSDVVDLILKKGMKSGGKIFGT